MTILICDSHFQRLRWLIFNFMNHFDWICQFQKLFVIKILFLILCVDFDFFLSFSLLSMKDVLFLSFLVINFWWKYGIKVLTFRSNLPRENRCISYIKSSFNKGVRSRFRIHIPGNFTAFFPCLSRTSRSANGPRGVQFIQIQFLAV